MTKPFIGVSGNILRDSGGAYVDLLRSYVNHDYPRSIGRGWWHSSYHSILQKNLDVARETVAKL